MASKTLQVAALYPNGLTVNVYLASDWTTGTFPTYNVAPPGSSVTSAVVSGGQLALTGLTASTEYVAGAEVDSHWRYVHFDTSVPTTPASSADVAAVSDDLTTHEALKTGVHGIPSMSSGEVPVWNGSAWIATNVATQAELDTHAALTTTAHGGLVPSSEARSAWGPRTINAVAATVASNAVFIPGTFGLLALPSAANARPDPIYLDPTRFTRTGLTAKLRLASTVAVNGTDPNITFTLGLYPVGVPSGAVNVLDPNLGTVVSGSTIAFAPPFTVPFTPPAETTSGAGGFTFPAAGLYHVGVLASGAMAANSYAAFPTRLDVIYA